MTVKVATLIALLAIALSNTSLMAQPNYNSSDAQIAMQYYRGGEFKKAAEAYKKLYYINRSQAYYSYYFTSLYKSEQLDEAEQLVKEHQKFNGSDLTLYVDLGYVYQLKKEETKSKNTYQSAIKKLPADQHQVIRLANAFMARQLYQYAELAYLEGKKLLKGQYGFQMDLAQLYYYQRNYDRMIDEYLALLAESEQYLETVQARLQNAVYNDIDDSLKEKLKNALLVQLNQNPEIVVYSELLIWLFIQDKQFEMAYIQAKSLDLRLSENGFRLVNLARIAQSNNDFDVAIKAYNYVIGKGKSLEYFWTARTEMLDVLFERVKLGIDTRKEDFLLLEQNYITAIEEMGSNFESVGMIRNLAHIEAFYLGKTAEATFLLEDAMTIRGINPQKKGELELELADVYLISGNVWEATFSYARVEEANKNNPTGSEAKYRKARLAYYIGNFTWSMAQLDVLKASTSKLIANDAAQLSLFIYDNTGWDTVETALETYARADFLNYRASDSLALITLDSVLNNYPGHELTDDAYFLKAKIYLKQGLFSQSANCYLTIVEQFPDGVLADKSLFALGNLYQIHFGQNDQAMEYYKQLMVNYPASVYAVEARVRFRALRGDNLIN